MMIPPAIAWFLLSMSTLGLGFWIVIAYRVNRTIRSNATIRKGLHAPQPPVTPRVTIIVPVHNEQDVIDACCRSLREQDYSSLEIIFVLDRCTDDTRSILRRHREEDDRIILVENDACPEDWAGKCNAAYLGAERAAGDYILFTDADTEFDPGLVRASIALATDRRLDLLSLLSTLRSRHPFELIAQPVASMNLIRMYPIERVNRADSPRPFANGQYMLFTRAIYERIGGHAAVKDDLLEDIAFARKVDRAGGRGGIFLADGMLTCSMYETLGEFRLGWKRIFIEACKRKPSRLRQNAMRVFANGVFLPAINLLTLIFGLILLLSTDPPLGLAMTAAGAGAVVAQHLTLVRIYTMAGAPRWPALLYPIGCLIVSRIMSTTAADLARRRPIPWAGREYVLEPRD